MGQVGLYLWIHTHWAQLIALGWALEKVLEILTQITKWKGSDNLGIILGKFLSRFSKKPA